MRTIISVFVIIVAIQAIRKYIPQWELTAIASLFLLMTWGAALAMRKKGIPLGWLFYMAMIMLTGLYASYLVMYSPLAEMELFTEIFGSEISK